MDGGRQIDWIEKQYRNADSPRFESRQPSSNVKLERVMQAVKHPSEIFSTDEGTQID
jgi:hypothetical protein